MTSAVTYNRLLIWEMGPVATSSKQSIRMTFRMTSKLKQFFQSQFYVIYIVNLNSFLS